MAHAEAQKVSNTPLRKLHWLPVLTNYFINFYNAPLFLSTVCVNGPLQITINIIIISVAVCFQQTGRHETKQDRGSILLRTYYRKSSMLSRMVI